MSKYLIKKWSIGVSSLVVTAGVSLLAGCASITNGTTQDTTFKSIPTGARIKVDNINLGKTPKTIKLRRINEHLITISLPGYKTETFKLTKTVSGWFFGNIIIGGILGIAIDAADGAMFNLTPEQLALASGGKITKQKHNTLTILLVNKMSGLLSSQKIGNLKRK